MSEKPILFNTDDVRAILDGRKTQTRWVVKPQPTKQFLGKCVDSIDKSDVGKYVFGKDGGSNFEYKNSFYQVGDILWVRETWQEIYDPEHKKTSLNQIISNADKIPKTPIEPVLTKLHGPKHGWYVYKVDESDFVYCNTDFVKLNWKPSIHMPREAARIFLKVTGVRVERLQEITEHDAEAEGIKSYWESPHNDCAFVGEDNIFSSRCKAFEAIWDSTLSKAGNKFKRNINSWADNPWVWVIEFERVNPC